jgi:hypothetical protein
MGVGSFVLTGLQLGWIASSQSSDVGMILLAAVAPVELLTAVVGFFVRDVVIATGLGLLTGSWASVGWLLASSQPGSTSGALGLLAIAVAVAMLVPAAGAAWSKPVATVLLTVAAARFIFTGAYELGAPSVWQTVSGYVGLVLCASGLYGSLALTLEDARHHTVLPTSRRSTAKIAMRGNLREELEGIVHEAGVRQET